MDLEVQFGIECVLVLNLLIQAFFTGYLRLTPDSEIFQTSAFEYFKFIYILFFSLQAKTFAKALGMDFTDEQTCWRIMRNAEQFGREVSDQVIFQFAFCIFFWSI